MYTVRDHYVVKIFFYRLQFFVRNFFLIEKIFSVDEKVADIFVAEA